MIINCYQTLTHNLIKTACELARKSYETGIRAMVIVPSEQIMTEFDQSLWSYSRKYFVPHATIIDPLNEQQPILINTGTENINQAKIILFINPKRSVILEILTKIVKNNDSIEKLVFLVDQDNDLQLININDMLEKTAIDQAKINFFIQKNPKSWDNVNPDSLT